MPRKKKLDVWGQMEARTGKGLTFWFLTIALATLLYNNWMQLMTTILQGEARALSAYIFLILATRLFLGFLFD